MEVSGDHLPLSLPVNIIVKLQFKYQFKVQMLKPRFKSLINGFELTL